MCCLTGGALKLVSATFMPKALPLVKWHGPIALIEEGIALLAADGDGQGGIIFRRPARVGPVI